MSTFKCMERDNFYNILYLYIIIIIGHAAFSRKDWMTSLVRNREAVIIKYSLRNR